MSNIKMLPRYRPKPKNGRYKVKTQEEYVNELKIKNPNVFVVGKYVNAKTPIEHYCMIHEQFWYTSPDNVLSGKGCQLCAKDKISKRLLKTHESYVLDLEKRHPHIIVVDKYINMKTKIKHYCTIHDVIFSVAPDKALHNYGCELCGREKLSSALAKTNEEYLNQVESLNLNVKVMGRYKNSKSKITFKCLIHNKEWQAVAGSILLGYIGCPDCKKIKLQKALSKTQELYIEQVKEVNPFIEVIGNYVNAHTQIKHKCLIHNEIWETSPDSILQGGGCKYCQREKLKETNLKSNTQYLEDLQRINLNIIPLEEYINGETKIQHKCLKCGYIWEVRPQNLLNGTGCPKCIESKGERIIANYLDNNKISYIKQFSFDNCKDIKPLPFDFYIPNLNICIEYDGIQHIKPIEYFGGEKAFKKQQKHDQIKDNYCKNNGITLLRIPYYKNIEEELNNFLVI